MAKAKAKGKSKKAEVDEEFEEEEVCSFFTLPILKGTTNYIFPACRRNQH